MVWAPCKNCGKETQRHSKDFCITCYKKLIWKPKKIICKRCKREMFHHSKGFCPGCYQFVFHLSKAKEFNYKKWHGISLELYKQTTKKCVVCEFSKIVELHHLDENKRNNSKENLIGLCPNHHKMIHNFKFRKEMRELLKQNGFNLLMDNKLDFELEMLK